MSDLISRQSAVDALEEQLDYLQMLNKDENPKAESKWYGVNWARNTIADLPSAEPSFENSTETKRCSKDTWTTEEVAEILANMFGDDCACNCNGIDEWLPESCKYEETGECPNPKEKHGCWVQFLMQGGGYER